MKIFIVSPNIDILITKNLKDKLTAIGCEIIYISDIKPLLEVTELYEGTEERILAIDPDFCNWRVENEVIEKIPNLKAIILQTDAFDWVDVSYCKEKEIPVVNLRGSSTEAVAEWALIMALNTARNIPKIVKNGWVQDYNLQGVELKDKAAGIIGMGRIGSRIAELVSGIGMNTQYWSRRQSNEEYKYVELGQLMKTSDVIFLALPLSHETKGMITSEMIDTMRKTAIFVSIVNHGIYDHEYLLNKTKNEEIFGYAFEEEGGKTFNNYEGNVWAGPALGWCTTESFRKNTELWVEATILASKGEFPTKVN
ncbi:hypothetical protein A2690_02860 [Candidatus Roizmanbacteria bacterium RIFCSPHIGHO2_01_FULL_39_12b]|uniref:D-isomer specific 2-hydroxyacid dehydrogenase NAD-binding domain-containing protein n=1 Tax=Candidatus Roizmanbacteria bacterium RIFCSPHIGHO2_01_FULL_39_12b TaxID=1802030 RepID=A0A1F7G7X0_9BACT|nr:MAG: hypothetical protein A2690_02860 [Candidatus Roizmanbacteria bacterium RIFCSPHIGHO2_01_FULL_39_12b]